jgi:hypothetical protein
MKVPDDFPRDVAPSALAGVQPKLAARTINGRFVVELTEEERFERWQLCEGLAQQLTVPARKDAAKHPQNSHEMVLKRIGVAIAGKDWCSVVEMKWIVARLRELLGWRSVIGYRACVESRCRFSEQSQPSGREVIRSLTFSVSIVKAIGVVCKS